ncbi:CheR family methyltransferase [Dyadobacter sp. 32]|jgi:chemotaxis protein methyltransferase CheR|uniref:CheR family methyltransferase n=1 Tax=Dyadobacter sp. 32 TaxID=538966 RepID=UPI0011F0269A
MVTDEEIDILLDDLLCIHGYDFTNYAKASLKRRVLRLYSLDKFSSFSELRYKIRTNQAYVERFVEEITVNVTEMFRDPLFYKALRNHVLPLLGTRPFIRIWHAGCATGEEVYSLAIMLREANLLHKSLLYATDLNPSVLDKVRKGIFPLNQMKQYSESYMTSGGQQDFSSYYTANYGQAKFKEELSEKIIISTHNLVSDGSFNEFDLILCRNVLIYFDKDLQDRALQLFDASLGLSGYLALGSKETLKFSGVQRNFLQLDKEKIWKKVS